MSSGISYRVEGGAVTGYTNRMESEWSLVCVRFSGSFMAFSCVVELTHFQDSISFPLPEETQMHHGKVGILDWHVRGWS